MKRFLKTKGFTLVELLVTLAISAVLLSAAVFGIFGYTRYSTFKKQNEYAQSLFVAAQTALTHYAENGELADIEKKIEKNGKLLSADMLSGEAKDNFRSEYENRIYYITVNKDGTVYGVSPALASSKAVLEIFGEIFEPFVYDKTILSGASVTIEFDPVGGVVYSVLYSDVKNAFVYGEASGSAVSISDRSYAVREDNLVGYYGIDSISDETSREKEKPVIESVRLENGTSLSLCFRLSDKYCKTATSELTYNIEVYSAQTKKLLMLFSVSDPAALQNLNLSQKTYGELKTQISVTLYDENGQARGTEKEYPFILYVDGNYTVHLLLDSVDLAALSAKSPNSLSGTYSMHRFDLEEVLGADVLKNIYVSVRGEGGRYKTTAWKRSNTENMYFASESESGYGIANARHLYNIRFEEEKKENKAVVYTVTSEFSWGGEDGIFSGKNGSEVFFETAELPEIKDQVQTAFPSISMLNKNHVFTASSMKYAVNGLVLRGEGEALGLFLENYGTITSCTLSGISVSGSFCVGSFCGINYGVVKNLTAQSGTVSGLQDVGGIVGADRTELGVGSGLLGYSGLSNGCTVSGVRYVGGIIGRLSSSGSYAVSLEKCRNTGKVLAAEGTIPAKTSYAVEVALSGLHTVLSKTEIRYRTLTERFKDNAGNLFYEFRKANGGYLAFSAQDIAALTAILETDSVSGIMGENGKPYSGTSAQQAAQFAEKYIWVPCALESTQGDITASDTPVNSKYSLVLVARPKGSTSFEDGTRTSLIYYNGTYLYHIQNGNRGYMTEVNNVRNISTQMTDLNERHNWYGYKPDNLTEAGISEPAYIGGIIGLADNSAGGVFRLSDCVSYPNCSEQELKNAAGGKLLGTYVGGIVGYCDNAVLTNCKTEGGGVFGKTYVGGIAGFVSGASAFDGNGAYNKANVLGESYVGGIAGCNAQIQKEDQNGFAVVSEGYSSNRILSNWKNRGVVIATKSMGGGITGYNAGRITECATDVEASSAMALLAVNAGGDKIGGVVGENRGKINAAAIGVIPFAAGQNYVGGVVGYNSSADDCRVTGYSCLGGYIYGKNFVGGFVGVNLSDRLFTDSNGNLLHIVSNPNVISGNYFVGGVIGGNVLYIPEDRTLSFDTDNFLGSVEAKAFAGGFIGFNMVVIRDEYAEAAVQKLAQYGGGTLSTDAAQVGALCGSYAQNAHVLQIVGKSGGGSSNNFRGITAGVYVGGVIGYNAETTKIGMTGLTNKSPITATDAIAANELTGAENLDPFLPSVSKTYSYAGGIVGKCTRYMTITNCAAEDTGKVVTKGTYTGGLVEVNEGAVVSCRAGSLGSSSKSYVGGIVGLNKEGAAVENCILSGKTVIGNNMVGGLVAENFGTVHAENTAVSGLVVGNGENVGGLVGCSHENASVSGYILSVSVQGNGVNVGGAVGKNMGEISAVLHASDFKGSVTGAAQVGGIIGLQTADATLERIENRADVTAQYGAAGGIVGRVDSTSVLQNCKNYGEIRVLGEKAGTVSAAGGITATVGEGTVVVSCEDYAAVRAEKGMLGGISGINNGTIQNCTVSGSITFSGDRKVGGAVGINNGTLSDTLVSGVSLVNLDSSVNGELGGLTAENNGTVSACTAENLSVISNASGVSMGGICGINNGEITGASGYSEVRGVTLRFTAFNLNYFGNIGGVTGVNRGTVSLYSFKNGFIYGTANDPANAPQYNPNYDYETNGSVLYGYGGIAGINGSATADSVEASITDCKLDGSVVKAMGDPNNIVNLGGVAGVNGKNAVISGFSYSETLSTVIAVSDETKITYGTKDNSDAAYANIGGAVGYNYGTVEKIGKQRAGSTGDGSTDASEAARKSSEDTATKVNVYTSQGHIGGIVGYNKSTGMLSDCTTGTLWNIEAKRHAQDNGAGGIIGYNSSALDMKRCDNWATVIKTATSSTAIGGIIGRQETTFSASWVISDCNNYGTVKGNVTGGIIGRWKYRGGTLYNCSNYGTIINTSGGEDSGGIVASLYAIVSDNYVYITDCKNYGALSPTGVANLGGVIGRINANCAGSRTVISNCVNTGMIKSAGNRAGIVAKCEVKSGISGQALVIRRCRNYGLPSDTGDVSFAGILGTVSSASMVTVNDCFGVQGGFYPITSEMKVLNQSNWFFTQANLSRTPLSVSGITVEDNATVPESWAGRYQKIVDGTVSGDSENAYITTDTQKKGSIVLNFNRQFELESVNLWIFFSNGTRKYKFSVFYSPSETGNDWYLYNDLYQNTWATDGAGGYYVAGENGFRLTNTQNPGEPVLARRVKILVSDTFGSSNFGLIEAAVNDTVQNWFSVASVPDAKNFGLGTPLLLSGTNGNYSALSDGTAVLSGLDFTTSFSAFSADRSAALRLLGAQNNSRQSAYLKLDAHLNPNASAARPSVPQITEVKDIGGGAQVVWECSDAYSYLVNAAFDDGSETEVSVYDKRFEISTLGKEGQNVTVTVTSVSVSGQTSLSSDSVTYTIPGKILPTPQIRLILTDLSVQDCYQVILENAKSYAGIGGVTVSAYLGQLGSSVTISVANDGTNTPVTVSGTDVEKGYTNYLITVQASPNTANSGYGLSARNSRETAVPGNFHYTSGAMGYVTNDKNTAKTELGFTGVTPQTLAYTVAVKSNSYTMFYRNEFLATDRSEDGLGVPVVYSFSEMRSSTTYKNSATDDYAPTVLASLPQDLNDVLENGEPKYTDISVRSYPISASNELVFTGMQLDSDLTKAELLKMKVSDNGSIDQNGTLLISGSGTQKTLKNGYVITKLGEDSYTLSYNALVKAYETSGTSESYRNQLYFFSNVTAGIPAEAKPVIEASYDEAAETYTATWNSVSGAAYSYTLVGTTKDGGAVVIASKSGISAAENRLELDTSAWSYTKVELTVSRHGSFLVSSHNTKSFGSSATETTSTKLKLSRIAVPYASLQNKNGLSYEILWNGLTDAQELAALDHYVVTVTATVSDGTELTAAYTTKTAAQTSLFIDLAALTGVDSDGNTVTGAAKGGSVVTVEVSAAAKANQTLYRAGPSGVPYELPVPVRLVLPETKNLTILPAAEKLSVTAFEEEGFTLTYDGTDPSYTDKEITGKYQLAIDVIGTDGTVLKQLSTKDAPFVMDGIKLGTQATITIAKENGLTAAYSGCSLRISVRAVSDSYISSLWSETVTLALPKVQVNSVAISEALCKLDTDAKVYKVGSDTAEGETLSVSQDALRWEGGAFCSGYEILLTRKEALLPEKDRISITFEKNGGRTEPVVRFTDAQKAGETETQVLLTPVVKTDGALVTYEFPVYEVRTDLVNSSGETVGDLCISLSGTVTIGVLYGENGEIQSAEYTLLLPDSALPAFEVVPGSVARDAFFTSEISIVTLAADGYVASDPVGAVRDENGLLTEK